MRALGRIRGRILTAHRLMLAGGSLLAISLLVTGLFFPRLFVHADTQGPWTYTIDGDSAVITGYDFDSGGTDVVIPSTLGGIPVVSISSGVFSGSEQITSLVVPGSVKTIGTNSFSNTPNLTEVELQQGVTSVEASAFYSSGLESLTLPDSIETIGSVSFADTPINSVVIPDSVTSLGYSPFYDSAVEELQIGSAEYEGDPYLVVTGLDNMPQLKNLSLGNNVISIDSMWQTPLLETINLGESVQTIKSVNPNSSHLDSITIPNSVTQIVSSFSGNNLNLTSLTIPDSVTSITSLYGPAFSDFTATNLYIGTSSFEGEPTMIIGQGNFNNITVDNLVFGDSVKDIGNGTFGGGGSANISHIDFGSSVQTIGTAFRDVTGLEDVTLPNSLLSISSSAFSQNPDLETVTIGTSDYQGAAQTFIQSSFSENPSLKQVTIGNVVKEISASNFYDIPSLETLSIGTLDYQGTPELSIFASFYGEYPNLTSLTFGNNLLSISGGSFNGLTALETLQLPDSIESVVQSSFGEMTSLRSLYIGTDSYNGPAKTTVGGFDKATALTDLRLGDTVKVISDGFLNNSTALTQLYIPNSVESITNSSLSSLTGLETLTIGTTDYAGPAKLIIENSSLYGSTSLSQLNLGNTLKEIRYGAMAGPTLLTELSLPDSLEYVGAGAFGGALTNLSSMTIGTPGYTGAPKLVIGSGTFSGAPITSLTMYSSLKTIEAGAFTNNLLTSLVIPDSVESIGGGSFAGNTLKHVTLGSGLISAAYAFPSSSIKTVTVRGTSLTIEDISNAFPTTSTHYIQVYTSDPSNPGHLADLVVREDSDYDDNGYLDIYQVFIVNPAQVTVRYQTADGKQLLPNTSIRIGTAEDYLLTDFENDHLDEYYHAGDSLSLSAPDVYGYQKPAPKTVSLSPGLNTFTFVYTATPPPSSSPTVPTSPSQPSSETEDLTDVEDELILDDFEEYSDHTGSGYSIPVQLGQLVKFAVGQERHSATLKALGDDYVIITIASTPRDVTIKLGQLIDYDADDDGTDDIRIYLASITDGVANLTFKKLAAASPIDSSPEVDRDQGTIPSTENTSPIFWWIGVAIIVLVAVTAITVKVSRNRSSNQ